MRLRSLLLPIVLLSAAPVAAEAQTYMMREKIPKPKTAGATQAPAPLIVNGDMSAATGWTFSSGGGYYADQSGRWGEVPSAGGAVGTMSQAVATTPGASYAIGYSSALKGGSYCSYPGGLTVTSGSTTLATDVAVQCSARTGSLTFTAPGSAVRVTFSSGAQFGQYASQLLVRSVVMTKQ